MDVYQVLLYLSVILLVGFLFGKTVEKFKLPDVTGYILAGVIIGPYGLNIVSVAALDALGIITSIVLSIIAYQIGAELFLPIIKKNAGKLVVITLFHALLTVIIVFVGIYFFTQELWLAFALSGLAVASAPAPIMQIVKKLKAKGPVKGTIIPVVGLLDIVAVVIFGLFASIALSLVDGSPISVQNALIMPLYEVALSIIVGAVLGLLLGFSSKFYIEKLPKKDRYIAYLALILAFILGSIWIAERAHLSLILVPLTIGMVFTNFIDKETYIIQNAALNNFGGPFVILFFTIAGLALSPQVMLDAGLIALVFIVLRIIGKISGTYLGATLTRCPTVVRKYTGLSLLPQAGITIGMLIALSAVLPDQETQLVQTIVLSSILIFQIIGPILTQYSLEKAQEVRR